VEDEEGNAERALGLPRPATIRRSLAADRRHPPVSPRPPALSVPIELAHTDAGRIRSRTRAWLWATSPMHLGPAPGPLSPLFYSFFPSLHLETLLGRPTSHLARPSVLPPLLFF
jgi:hypothetical protein